MSAISYRIRQATLDDQDRLIEFGRTEFTRTFGHLYRPEDLEAYLSEGYDPSLYEKWLTHNQFRLFLAAETDSNRIVGYVLCGLCTLPLENCGFDSTYSEGCREVKRLYLHPDYFGSNLSSALLKVSLDWLVAEGFANKVYLGVYSENPRAIRFYQKHGFEQIGEYGFVVGDQIDREFICHWKGFPSPANN